METGAKVPEWQLQQADGATLTSAELAGTAYVLYFYPKANTPGCTTEALDFTRLAAEFAKSGVRVIAVSKDGPKKLTNFQTKHDLTVTLASDEGGHVTEDFGAWGEKKLYGKVYMGIERCTFLIDGAGKLVEQWRKVKVKDHAEAVLEAARAL